MKEKRNSRRLDLDVIIDLERIDNGNTTVKSITVETIDLSRSGIGFKTQELLELDSFYNVKLQIWTKETINAIIKIVRRMETPDGYHYGAFFIGMTEKTELKIEIYEMLYENNEKNEKNE